MLRSLFLISLALSSAACSPSQPEDVGGTAARAKAPGTSATANAAADDGAKAMNFESSASRNGGNREFSYSWPAAVSRIPALAAQLDAEREREFAAQESDWLSSLEDFPEGCVSCISRGYEKEWKVVADLPGYLSLSADLYLYTGGAHGTGGKTSIVWDKERERGIAGVEMFQSAVALETALGPRLCNALNAQREDRRGMKVDPKAQDSFNQCPGLDEGTVLVGSSNGQTFDRIGIYFGPYVAGAYAEGDYELNFPVTAAVLDAVKAEFASAFSVKR